MYVSNRDLFHGGNIWRMLAWSNCPEKTSSNVCSRQTVTTSQHAGRSVASDNGETMRQKMKNVQVCLFAPTLD